MDISPGVSQGQGKAGCVSEIDNNSSPSTVQGILKGAELTLDFDVKPEKVEQKPDAQESYEIGSKNITNLKTDHVTSTSSNVKEFPITGCAIKNEEETITETDSTSTETNGYNISSKNMNDSITSTMSEHKESPIDILQTASKYTPSVTGDQIGSCGGQSVPSDATNFSLQPQQLENKLCYNTVSEPPGKADNTELSDSKDETASGEASVLDEVGEKVTKLNISGEEPKSMARAAITPSKVVINKQTESLQNLMAYSDSEVSETEFEERAGEINDVKKDKEDWRKIRDNTSDTSDSESDSSASTLSSDSETESDKSDGDFSKSEDDSASVIDASDDGVRSERPLFGQISDKGAVKKTNKTILDLPEFLPPIPDLSKLNINAGEEFMHIGNIAAVIAELVTVEAIRGSPAFDLDSMLFIDDQTSKKALGPIFDVLGPVTEPIYCVRFNNEDEIKKLGIKNGMKVYAAPKSEVFSKFVFVTELMKLKGCDASWRNDQETPVELVEYSDDEQEREARRAAKGTAKRKLEDSSLERHKKYEKTMNQCNTLNTRVCKLMDAHKNLSRQIRPTPKEHMPSYVQSPTSCQELPSIPPEFNPAVPPPGFGHPSPYGYPPQGTPFAPAPPAFGQPFSLSDLSFSPQNGSYGTPAPAVFAGPVQFGSFYANQPPAPHSLAPPPARWQQCDNFRRGRHNQRSGHRQNADNYFTNNSRTGAGPSSQPF